jgi:hypothetical protein
MGQYIYAHIKLPAPKAVNSFSVLVLQVIKLKRVHILEYYTEETQNESTEEHMLVQLIKTRKTAWVGHVPSKGKYEM